MLYEVITDVVAIPGFAARHRPPVDVGVDAAATHRAARQRDEMPPRGVGVARRAFPPLAAMAGHLGRVDTREADTRPAAIEGIAIDDAGIPAGDRVFRRQGQPQPSYNFV